MNEQYDHLPKWLKDRLVFKIPKASESEMPPELDYIDLPESKCADCDETICGKPRVVRHKLVDGAVPFWRSMCEKCRCYNSPETGLFNLDAVTANYQYDRHAKRLAKKLKEESKEDK